MQNEPKTIDLRSVKRVSKRQRNFIKYWLQTDSDSFGNAYQSALRAGYPKTTARVITASNPEWIRVAKAQLIRELQPDHIYGGLQQIALTGSDANKLRALELMAKIKGMFIDRTQSEVNVTFTNKVPRPVIEVDNQAETT